MLVPMAGFFLMLLLFGGIPSLVVLIDPYAARRAHIPFAMFFSGLGFYVFFVIGGLVDAYVSHLAGGFIITLMAPLVGGIGGGFLGYQLGARRRRRVPNDNL
jgi:hypothetical protein